ncbi:Asparagine--tRNA ligase, cytoplasmic, partial [Clarias magur]
MLSSATPAAQEGCQLQHLLQSSLTTPHSGRGQGQRRYETWLLVWDFVAYVIKSSPPVSKVPGSNPACPCAC